MIDRDWRTYLDRKVVHFAYFYVLWVTIQFGFKAPGFAAESGWAHVGLLYLQSFIEPFGTLWFIYLLPIFFVVSKLTRQHAAARRSGRVAALLEIAQIQTGWTVIDEFAARFVYFYSGYLSRRLRVRAGRIARGRIPSWALVGPRAVGAGQWRAGLRRVSANGRWCRWRSGFAGALAIVTVGTLLARMRWLNALRLLRRAFDRHLSGLLPADGGDAHPAAQDRHRPRHRHDLADRHDRRRRRRDRDLAGGLRPARQLPVRASRRVLACAEARASTLQAAE